MRTLDSVVDAAAALDIQPRTRRWAHLSLCVLDAVFSVGARYTSTRRTCERYAAARDLIALVDAGVTSEVIGTDAEQPLSEFVHHAGTMDAEQFARDVLGNRQRTSSRSGVLKAEAAVRYARVLVDAGVECYADVPGLFADDGRLDHVAAQLRSVPGNGASDVRLGYLWMLLGDENVIKPDRMVLRWLSRATGASVTAEGARVLLADAAEALDCTPWALDHAIWNAERRSRPRVGSDSTTVRRYRAHQGRWRSEVLGLPPGPPSTTAVTETVVDSMLPTAHEGRSAGEAGWNLMSPAAVAYACARVPVVKAAKGVVETDRLWRNMLSSQPLAFSVVGELRAHPDVALAVLSELANRKFVAFDRIGAHTGAWELDGLQAEWAPPPGGHTNDRSGFDIAAALRTAAGQRVLVTIEVKYTDRFSRERLDPSDYERVLADVGLDLAATTRLVDAGASQFLRSVLLTESVRRGGTSGVEILDEVLAVVLCREDDSTAAKVVEAVGDEQKTVPVAHWGLARFLEVTSRYTELADWADAVHARYLLDDIGTVSGAEPGLT